MRVWPALGRAAALLSAAVTLLALLGIAPLSDLGRAAPHPTTANLGDRSARHVVLALGDSVPAGTACGCRPFPELYGALLGRAGTTSVTVTDDAVSGLDSTGLLDQLRTPAVRGDVRRADVVLVTVGANDFTDHHDEVVRGGCDTTPSSACLGDEVTALRSHLDAALAGIRALRGDHPTTVLVTGYWNVFEDGQVMHDAAGGTGLRASLRLTRTVNAAIRSAATAAGARYVDLFDPFQGAGGEDIDSLLAADGDHPDAAGHRLIARTLLDAGLARTSWR